MPKTESDLNKNVFLS